MPASQNGQKHSSAFDHFVGLVCKGLTRSFQLPIQQFQSKNMKSSRESIHPDYESILKSIKSKIMKDCVKDRFDMIVVSAALLKLHCNLIHSSQHENKFILCKIFLNFFQTFFNFFHFLTFIHFKLSWIKSLSNLSNCLLEQGENMFSFN